MIRKANPDTDQISRSLLQKAVRRADLHMTKLAIKYIIGDSDFDWLRKRLAVVTFEECWTYGDSVSFENNPKIIADHFLNIVRTKKNKDAAGLGSLAYEHSKGEGSVLTGEKTDRDIRIISEAIKRPKDFWTWVHSQTKDERQKTIVSNAEQGFKKAGWPWDRAFAQAAAYLAVTTIIPVTKYVSAQSQGEFPLWVAIDKHTPQGKTAIREAAKRLGVKSTDALWIAFYFESAKCNDMETSPWWEREMKWRMGKLRTDIDTARNLWDRLRPIVKDLLKEETEKLKERIFDNQIEENSKDTQATLFR